MSGNSEIYNVQMNKLTNFQSASISISKLYIVFCNKKINFETIESYVYVETCSLILTSIINSSTTKHYVI